MSSTNRDVSPFVVNANAKSVYFPFGGPANSGLIATFNVGVFSQSITFYPRIYNYNYYAGQLTVIHIKINEIKESDSEIGTLTPLTSDQLIGTYADTRTTYDITGGILAQNLQNGIGVVDTKPYLFITYEIEELTTQQNIVDLVFGVDVICNPSTYPPSSNAYNALYFEIVAPVPKIKDDGKDKNWVPENYV